MTVRTRPRDLTLGSKKVGSIARSGVIVDKKTGRERGAVTKAKIQINKKLAAADAAVTKLEMELTGRAGDVLTKTKKFGSPVRIGQPKTFNNGRVTVRKAGSVQVRLRKKGAVPFNKLPKHVQISAKERTLRQLKAQVRTQEARLENLTSQIEVETKKLAGTEAAFQDKGKKLTQMLNIMGDVKGNMLNFSTTLAEYSKTIREAADVDEETATKAMVESLLTKDGDECTVNPLVETVQDVVEQALEPEDGFGDEPTLEEIFQAAEVTDPEVTVDEAETWAMFDTTSIDVDPMAAVLKDK